MARPARCTHQRKGGPLPRPSRDPRSRSPAPTCRASMARLSIDGHAHTRPIHWTDQRQRLTRGLAHPYLPAPATLERLQRAQAREHQQITIDVAHSEILAAAIQHCFRRPLLTVPDAPGSAGARRFPRPRSAGVAQREDSRLRQAPLAAHGIATQALADTARHRHDPSRRQPGWAHEFPAGRVARLALRHPSLGLAHDVAHNLLADLGLRPRPELSIRQNVCRRWRRAVRHTRVHKDVEIQLNQSRNQSHLSSQSCLHALERHAACVASPTRLAQSHAKRKRHVQQRRSRLSMDDADSVTALSLSRCEVGKAHMVSIATCRPEWR